jgi:DNA-binding beta-propeller fold protein YncE
VSGTDAGEVLSALGGRSIARLRYLGFAVAVALLASAAAAFAATGALTPAGCTADPLANPAGCTQTAPGLGGASAVAVSPDGKSVYATSINDNAIVRFDRNTTTGALTPAGCVGDVANNTDGCAQTAPGLVGPYSVTVSPDGKSVYAAGTNDSAIVRLDRNTTTGALTPKGCIGDPDINPPKPNVDRCAKTTPGLEAVRSVAVSPDGKSVYAAGRRDNAIVRFKRDTTSGALTPKGCVADPANNEDNCAQTARGLDGASSVAVSANGKSVYAAGLNDAAIVNFDRDTTGGALTRAGCVADPAHNADGCAKTADGLDFPRSVAVSADGKSVYAAGSGDNAIVRLNRSTTSGALTPTGCIADPAHNHDGCAQTALGLDFVSSVAVSADGKSVYAAGYGNTAIVNLNRNTTSGALTPAGCVADPVNNPGCAQTAPGLAFAMSVAVSGDGKSVYIAGYGDGAFCFPPNPCGSGDNAVVRFDRAP